MYARKHKPEAAEQMAAGIDRTVGALAQAVAAAQQRGEIVDGDPEQLTLVVGTALHGLASFAVTGMFTTEAAMQTVPELVHHLMYGLKPR